MIADDNPYALEALRDAVDWEEFDLSLVGTFLNGQDLLEAARVNTPDVVITDISMPKLNGIALTSALWDISSHIKIVFLSNYSDFEYAQKAVQLHITDYLLKPFEPTQIIAVMKKIVQELCDERMQRFEEIRTKNQVDFYRSLARESYFSKLLYQAEEESLIVSKLHEFGFSLPDTVQLCVAHILMPAPLGTSYAESSAVIRSILQTHQKSDYELIWLFYDKTDFSVLVLYSDPNLDIENLLSQLHIDIETTTGINAAIGFSSVSNAFSDLGELHTQAVIAATQKDAAKNAVINYDEVLTKNTTLSPKHSTSTISNYVAEM
jgi:DNA-binding NarL/FixJ family response regulator